MITLTKLAESVTPLKESLLSKTKDKVADTKKTLHFLSRLPNKKDWKKIASGYACKWDITFLRETEHNHYDFIDEYDYLMFFWTGNGSGVVSCWLGCDENYKDVVSRQVHYQCGWGSKITEIKNDINTILTKMLQDPKIMDKVLYNIENDYSYDLFYIL